MRNTDLFPAVIFLPDVMQIKGANIKQRWESDKVRDSVTAIDGSEVPQKVVSPLSPDWAFVPQGRVRWLL